MLRCLDRRCESTLHTPCAGLIALSCELTFISYARSAGGGRRHVLTELLREHDVVELAREQLLLLTEELICMRSVKAVAVAAAMAARGPARGGQLALYAQRQLPKRILHGARVVLHQNEKSVPPVRASSAVARARWPAGAARGARRADRASAVTRARAAHRACAARQTTWLTR